MAGEVVHNSPQFLAAKSSQEGSAHDRTCAALVVALDRHAGDHRIAYGYRRRILDNGALTRRLFHSRVIAKPAFVCSKANRPRKPISMKVVGSTEALISKHPGADNDGKDYRGRRRW